uniref:Fatty acid desaturase domain-containing protein n=1 Tax=Lotharella oceanica TaxID=641309 RepID=A0A7S2XF31_9EUKA|mmetsp:Transcript_29710/g.55561  ORF Transcript_29710/g.55561 Transcript_29710/m.55561 type:complete len:302 (+) Transcript_29710:203-1108(+)
MQNNSTPQAKFLRNLSPDVKASLTIREDGPGLRHLIGHISIIVLLGGGIAARINIWPLLLLPYGILVTFLFTLSHECTHRTPFLMRWINEVVGHAIAPILALPFVWFRHFHAAHHRFTNDPEKDPELIAGGRPKSWKEFIRYLTGWGYWCGQARVLWTNAFCEINASYIPRGRHTSIRREALAILLFYTIVGFSIPWPLLLRMWIIPVVIGQPFLRVYLLAEHGMCPQVTSMFENTRTTYTSWIIRAMAWNMPYHAEHHFMPSVPFHKLPALNCLVAGRLRSTSNGYVGFLRQYINSLSNR